MSTGMMAFPFRGMISQELKGSGQKPGKEFQGMRTCFLLHETGKWRLSATTQLIFHHSGFVFVLEFFLLDIFLVELLLTITFVMTWRFQDRATLPLQL
jgi:hypothetical protein